MRTVDRSVFRFDFADIYGEGLAGSGLIRECGGTIHTLPDFRKHPGKSREAFRKILREERYDIVHFNMLSAANLLFVNAAVSYGKSRIVVHSHNSGLPSGTLRRILNRANLGRLRKAPVEKWACGRLAGRFMWGDAFDPADIVPNAVDCRKFSPDPAGRARIRSRYGIKEGEKVAGFAGRFFEQKNVLFLPDILEALLKRDPAWKMLLVGDGVLKEALSARFEEKGLSDCVVMAGEVSDMPSFYSAMDVFVLPSLFEGLPMVGIEAQAMGLPCFVSDAVSDELALTGLVRFIPLSEGAGIWAETIEKGLSDHPDRPGLPEAYRLDHAARHLEERYRKLAGAD